MKKLITLLVALVAFFACNTEEEPAIDYSTWTNEELLADPNGIDYLVKHAGPVDHDALYELFQRFVLVEPDSHSWFGFRGGQWHQELIDGPGFGIPCYVAMGDDIYRKCYMMAIGHRIFPAFEEWSMPERPIDAIIKHTFPKSRIAAVVDRIIIVDVLDKPNPTRVLYRFTDTREDVLETYTFDWKKEYINYIDEVQ